MMEFTSLQIQVVWGQQIATMEEWQQEYQLGGFCSGLFKI